MELDAKTGRMRPVLTSRNSESFRGCNDLHIAGNGDIYFTDQGQTGLHDPTGRVYRLARDGRLDCLIDTGISPNGLVLDPTETVLFVAMTRDNAVWRVPLMKDGSVSKVGRFCSTFGASGPDGMTMDKRAGCSWRTPRSAMCSCSRPMANWSRGSSPARGRPAPMSRSAATTATVST